MTRPLQFQPARVRQVCLAVHETGCDHAGNIRENVGLMTQLDTVSHPIRLKSSDETFSGTNFVCHKTCVTTVDIWQVSRLNAQNGLMTHFANNCRSVARPCGGL